MKKIIEYITFVILTCSVSLCCSEKKSGEWGNGSDVFLSIVTTASSINTDNILWEDRVDELRMMMFSEDGTVVFNEKLYFPEGFDQRSSAIQVSPGTYDFYFFANETSVNAGFVQALLEVTQKSDFVTDSRFTSIPYDPSFIPDGTTDEGRILMSAIYENITLATGGTPTNPQPLPLPTSKVELIRSLAKVDVIFRKKVPGSPLDDGLITSVQLTNVASVYSVPPVDDYYTGQTVSSSLADLSGFNYENDSIGIVTFYIPEFLVAQNGTEFTELHINNKSYPIESDNAKAGLNQQRRAVTGLSENTVIRNYHYIINAYVIPEGGVQVWIYVEPWKKDTYLYIFQGDLQITLPPVLPGDSSIIIPTECGRIEILSHNENLQQGLQGAYNDVVNYYDPEIQGPIIYLGDPPYYCEKKYGSGWRLINSCELMSFLGYFDRAYNIWTSNTWEADTYNMQYYPLAFRQAAQEVLESLTGFDLSSSVLMDENNWADELTDLKLDILDRYFTPGDIVVKEEDYPNGWPFASPPGTGSNEQWFYNEVVIQVKAYWYGPEYISPSIRENWDRILYEEFVRYDYSSTVSRCVRYVD